LCTGVGIKGEEGLQAVNSADFAIAQFRYLSDLMLKHGRYNYIRMSSLVCYMFYKNILMSIAQFWFNFNCGFSGQKYYTEGR
jgi:P-type E1-E2 ATPase